MVELAFVMRPIFAAR